MSRFVILLLLSYSIKLAAIEKRPCLSKIPVDTFKEIENLEKHLEWHGADNTLIQKAPCKSTKILSNEELIEFILKRAGKSSISGSSNGVNFENESAVLIDAFNKLTTARDIFGSRIMNANQKNFQNEFSINPECKKVICAINKIWGDGVGVKMLYVLLKHNFNTSEYVFEDSDRFKIDELDDVILGLEDIPQSLIPIGKINQRLTHYSSGYKLKGDPENTAANAVIMLFDRWSNEPRFERQYSVFHELSHNISNKLNQMDESLDWLKLTDWIKKGENWSNNGQGCFASKYALKNPWEDFAETLSTYRYNAKLLKESCPAKYNFVKEKVFNGLEYLSNETCGEIDSTKLQSIVNDLNLEIQKKLATYPINETLFKEKCSSQLSSYPLKETDLKDCMVTLIKEQNELIGDEPLKILLSKNNVKYNSLILSQIKSGIAEKLGNEIVLNSPDLVTKLKKSGDQFFENIISEALPKIIDGKNLNFKMGFLDYQIDSVCRAELWSTNIESRRKCVARYALQEDKLWTKYGQSRNFNKLNLPENLDEESKNKIKENYYFEIENVLSKTILLDGMMQNKANEFKKLALNYFQNAGIKLFYEKSDWKKSDPHEFCQKFYNSPDEFYLKYLLPKDSNGFPGFIEWCTEKQSKQKKRFVFEVNDINEYINSRIK
jgi:hypothetical protein